jgi:hypothetical protein
MNTRSLRPLTKPTLFSLTLFTVSSLAATPAHALSNTEPDAPDSMPPDDGRYEDLGDYDSTTTSHSSYGITSTSSTNFQTISPTQIWNDPCESKSAYDWTILRSKQGEFGNSSFGAGYYAGVRVGSNAGRGTDPDKMWADGNVRGYVTIFGIDKTVASVSGYAELKGTKASYRFNVTAMGFDQYNTSGSANLSGNPSSTYKLFEASKTVWLGPLPVKVTGGAAAQLGMTWKVYYGRPYNDPYGQPALNFDVKPNGRIYGYARASVDFWDASAGISGELDFVKAELPNHADLKLTPTSYGWNMTSTLNLTSLSGRLQLFACWDEDCWKQALVSWSPLYSGTYRVVNMQSCQATITSPVCGNKVCDGGETYTNCPADCPAPPPPPDSDGSGDGSICEQYPWKCGAEP